MNCKIFSVITFTNLRVSTSTYSLASLFYLLITGQWHCSMLWYKYIYIFSLRSDLPVSLSHHQSIFWYQNKRFRQNERLSSKTFKTIPASLIYMLMPKSVIVRVPISSESPIQEKTPIFRIYSSEISVRPNTFIVAAYEFQEDDEHWWPHVATSRLISTQTGLSGKSKIPIPDRYDSSRCKMCHNTVTPARLYWGR